MATDQRAVNQENWKRTQVRLPPETHEKLISYARENNYSLNTAIIKLLDAGLQDQQPVASQEEINAAIKAFLEQYMSARKKEQNS